MSRFSFRVWGKTENEYISGFAMDMSGWLWREGFEVDLKCMESLVVEFSTGLTDVDGREIFEGDRVLLQWVNDEEDHEEEGYVKWSPGFPPYDFPEFAVLTKCSSMEGENHRLLFSYSAEKDSGYTIKVIGTIHDKEE
jgi:uncharacterized phage protein (TIGR01671 family)